MEYTKRPNLNRRYMKLEVWQRGMDLFALAVRLAEPVSDFGLKSRFSDVAQSVSANIAEGCGRRTLPEYRQFLHTAKGSHAEALTRACGRHQVRLIADADFKAFDQLHYEEENKLLRLVGSLESKRDRGGWQNSLPHPARGD